jgi:hypothetical protein
MLDDYEETVEQSQAGGYTDIWWLHFGRLFQAERLILPVLNHGYGRSSAGYQ